MMRRVRWQVLKLAQQRKPHRPTCCREMACGNKAIAAIISRPAQNRHGALWPACLHSLGNRAAGSFHKVDALDPAGDRPLVSFVHLTWSQECDIVGFVLRWLGHLCISEANHKRDRRYSRF